jgi:hypothetical protein
MSPIVLDDDVNAWLVVGQMTNQNAQSMLYSVIDWYIDKVFSEHGAERPTWRPASMRTPEALAAHVEYLIGDAARDAIAAYAQARSTAPAATEF